MRDGTLTELIDQQLRPNVVRIDTEGFYPEAFLRRLGAIGGGEQILQARRLLGGGGVVCGLV